MNDALLEDYAKLMQKAYTESRNRDNAIAQVLHEVPAADVIMLRGMWEAIDSYVDHKGDTNG